MQAGPNTHQNVDSVAPGYNPWTGGLDGRPSRCNLTGGELSDLSVRLVVGGVPVGDEKATPGDWPYLENDGSVPAQVYGGPADSWGLTLTPGDVGALDFGVSVRCRDSTEDESATRLFTCYTFDVPAGATVTGITAAIERGNNGGGRAVINAARLTVHYMI